MSVKGAALRQLSDMNLRQVVLSLAEVQGLPDDHPVWAQVAMLASIIKQTNTAAMTTDHEVAELRKEISELKNILLARNDVPEIAELRVLMPQVRHVLAGTAELNSFMRVFVNEIEGVCNSTRKDVFTIKSMLARLKGK